MVPDFVVPICLPLLDPDEEDYMNVTSKTLTPGSISSPGAGGSASGGPSVIAGKCLGVRSCYLRIFAATAALDLAAAEATCVCAATNAADEYL